MPRKCMSFSLLSALLFLCISMYSCTQDKKQAIFRKLSASASGIYFKNQLTYSDSLTVLDFEYMFNGAGVALIDVNNDGLQDIFFSGNMVSSRLYLNKGQLKFEDITEKAGLTTTGWAYGAAVVDINQDGYSDIYLCKAGYRKTPPDQMQNQFFINNGNNTFTDKAAEMGLNSNGYDVHAAFFDYDKDGDLDMYLLRNAFVNYNRNTARSKISDGAAASTDKLFRNDSGLHFTDVSATAGIKIEGFGLGVAICDLNNDGWPDVYVSNDFLTNDLVWINNKNGTFTNKAPTLLRHETYNGMGNDVADYNNDGLEDVVVVDMLPPDNKRWKLTMRGNTYEEFQNAMSYGYEPQYVRNTLQLNNGDGSFSEIGQLAGVHATEWSWAPLFADYDNDGYKDLFISNGYRQDITNLDFIKYGKRANFVGTPEANRKERLDQLKNYPGIEVHNYLFKNKHDLSFTDASEEWGMTDPSYSNGAAYADLDNDGDLDLVTNNLDQVSVIYENRLVQLHPEKNWLRIALKGAPGNLNGLGAKVWLWQNGQQQFQYFSPYRGYLSTVEPYLHFGILKNTVDSLKIEWPDGSTQLIRNVAPARLLWLNQKDAILQKKLPEAKDEPSTIFGPYPFAIKYLHQEDPYVDFKLQPLLPKNYSHEGPGLAVADVNGDGREDFFIGAAAGNTPTIFIQQKNGAFEPRHMADSSTSDNMGALFFDADGDADADLYVASGGTLTQKKSDPVYRHHFYLNDGQGNFMRNDQALPNITSSSSGVRGADMDKDGDIDLFVAGRINPGEYPTSPRSFLLRNDSKAGQVLFTDISTSAGVDLSSVGMVTDVLFTDFDNDGWSDLVLVGEYMPLRFYKNNQGKFSEITATTGLTHTNGWWNSITGADFDKDGDIDYVAGNLGLNSSYTASATEPICVYANDYDKDGKLDPVLCHYVDGVEQVFHARDDINRQMTPFRARFRTYQAYADVKFTEAFRKDEIANAMVLKAERFASAYIENLGNGKFKLHDLPLTAQFAPVFAMQADDFDGDGNLDVMAVGNSFSTEVQTGRYDAQGTLFLQGNGKGGFMPQKKQLNIQSDNKSIARLYTATGTSILLIGSNADSLHTVRIKNDGKFIEVLPNEAYCIFTLKDGKTYRHELYYGQSYLSQSSRKIAVPLAATAVQVFSFTGTKREIRF
ncbi:VCBS repeat-containing protein [Flavihumibacter fluvii]|uniref:VCBS repeat-containing protein n=1 Tax=Flavihumibacter fluvii TaxID=2838157 RepID=UPI001BDE2942|nr:VCBS repeat-containing protein [Flavihumibacter fluvii]ULQ51302.1 VCBS repeat-containing protein [Flavihumibacter fluvii]